MKKIDPNTGISTWKEPNLNRDFQAAHERIMKDDFVEQSVYPEALFRRRFRMSKRLFMKIFSATISNTPFLKERS